MRSEQLHPAVLLRYMRLTTSIRLANRASWHTWCMIFAGYRAPRSWLSALHRDIRWLAASTKTFENMNSDNVAEWLQMAKRAPNQTTKALRKVCAEEKAIAAAEGLACGFEAGPAPCAAHELRSAPVEKLQCRYCEYMAKPRTSLQCHESRLHGHANDLTRCIDTATCSVCALTFSSIDGNMTHVYHSEVCRLNHLLRGPFS